MELRLPPSSAGENRERTSSGFVFSAAVVVGVERGGARPRCRCRRRCTRSRIGIADAREERKIPGYTSQHPYSGPVLVMAGPSTDGSMDMGIGSVDLAR